MDAEDSWAASGSQRHRRGGVWLARRLDKSTISQFMGINWCTVGTIIERAVEQRLDARQP